MEGYRKDGGRPFIRQLQKPMDSTAVMEVQNKCYMKLCIFSFFPTAEEVKHWNRYPKVYGMSMLIENQNSTGHRLGGPALSRG